MASLRERMIEDMMLAGYAPGTRRIYLDQARRLAKHYMIAPDQLTEQQVRDYFLYLREEKKVARGTFETAHAAIRFLCFITLDRDWSLFSKKRSRCRSRSGCPTRDRTMTFANSSARSTTPSIALACVRCTRAACA
jgi:Phage integrase, N-terminal SAM-like domain